MKNLYLIGYSGHAFVVADSAISDGYKLMGYFESKKKDLNPFQLEYMGSEDKFNFAQIKGNLFIGIGNNYIRGKAIKSVSNKNLLCNVIDKTAVISNYVKLETGIYVGKRAVINPLSEIGEGAIINTGAVVEHECKIGNYTHVAPMAVLCGNVSVGENSFVGANSVVKQGVIIGSNVTIGAGSVITKDIPDNVLVYGNPAVIKNQNQI